VKYSLNIKQNNKSLFRVVMMTMINKNTSQRVVASIGKIGIEFHLSHLFVFWLTWQYCALWLILMPV